MRAKDWKYEMHRFKNRWHSLMTGVNFLVLLNMPAPAAAREISLSFCETANRSSLIAVVQLRKVITQDNRVPTRRLCGKGDPSRKDVDLEISEVFFRAPILPEGLVNTTWPAVVYDQRNVATGQTYLFIGNPSSDAENVLTGILLTQSAGRIDWPSRWRTSWLSRSTISLDEFREKLIACQQLDGPVEMITLPCTNAGFIRVPGSEFARLQFCPESTASDVEAEVVFSAYLNPAAFEIGSLQLFEAISRLPLRLSGVRKNSVLVVDTVGRAVE